MIEETVSQVLPLRDVNTHKGNYGKILLLCGSKGYTGAAALSAMGALRSGAGLVYLGVPESIYIIEAVKLSEPVILCLPDHEGMLSRDSANIIKSILPKMDAVLIGPGLGVSADTFEVVKAVLENAQCPVVLDADGINAVVKHMDILRNRTHPTILTPHDGEFTRMGFSLGDTRDIDAARAAEALGAIVLLKGHRTVITDGQTCYINYTGNPGMATGGSGDVLAGIITSLIGQGVEPLTAAACGAWLHGSAGDLCAKRIGQYGMLPQDMIRVLPELLK